MEFKDVDIIVPWGQVSCRWYGNRQVRPLLAIHGYTDNMGTFARLIPLLPSHLGVICIEQPGHGRSSPYPPGVQYTLYDWACIIRRVVLHFKWKRVSLIGHSLGAVACNIYASLFAGDHVDMLIAIDMLTVRYKNSDAFIKYLTDGVESMLKPPRAPKLFTAEQLKDACWPTAPLVSKEHARSLLERCIVPSPVEPDKFYLSRDLRILHMTHLPIGVGLVRELNNRIRNIPYLVIKATDSDFINDGAIPAFAILRKNNPKFEYHLVQGNHHVHIDDPEQLAAWIVPFINKHRPANRWEEPGHLSDSKL